MNSSSIINNSLPLGSTIIYNDNDEIPITGYIDSITFLLPIPFNISGLYGAVLTFYIILNNSIISTYAMVPDSTALLQSFNIPSWLLIVYPGSFLGIGVRSDTIRNRSWSDYNRIYRTQSGNAYWVQNYFEWVTLIQPQWIGDGTGVALAFDVVYNRKWLI